MQFHKHSIQEALRDAEAYVRMAEAGAAERISTTFTTPQNTSQQIANLLIDDYEEQIEKFDDDNNNDDSLPTLSKKKNN